LPQKLTFNLVQGQTWSFAWGKAPGFELDLVQNPKFLALLLWLYY